jgi:hypothetical protein
MEVIDSSSGVGAVHCCARSDAAKSGSERTAAVREIFIGAASFLGVGDAFTAFS